MHTCICWGLCIISYTHMSHIVVLKSTDSGATVPEFKSQLYHFHFLAVNLEISLFAFFFFFFLPKFPCLENRLREFPRGIVG